jgi:effector-binding domain-containing protein
MVETPTGRAVTTAGSGVTDVGVNEATAKVPDACTGRDASDGGLIQPLFGQLFHRLGAAGLRPCVSPVAYYEDAENDTIRVHAAVPVDAGATADVDILELPELAQAATIVHQGDMMEAERSMQTLARWIEDNGYRS